MQFKHPEIFYSFLLLLVPILVHLFQLRKFKTEYFTNVKFLKALNLQTRKSATIKKWLLLACRLLLLTCLIVAFAQPYFLSKDYKNAQNNLYIILDNSYSMQAKGKQGALLKRTIQELLEHTPDNIKFSIFTNDAVFWDTDIKSLQKELQNITYSTKKFDISVALSQIRTHQVSHKKDIVVISDAIGTVAPFQQNPENENYYFINPTAEQQNNVSIDSVYISQKLDNFYEITVKTKYFGSDFQDIPLTIMDQNKMVGKTIIQHKGIDHLQKFTIPKKDFHGFAQIQDNGLLYDNTYYFSLSTPKLSRVLSIGNAANNGFLKKIYTSDSFEFKQQEVHQIQFNELENQDVIILNELDELSQSIQNTLFTFVNNGGSLIIIPSENQNNTSFNAFLKQLGTCLFLDWNEQEKLIQKINFSHPIFQNVFEKQMTNFQYPFSKKSLQIQNPGSWILNFDDQSPFLVQLQNPLAQIFIFASPLNKKISNFQNAPLIVPVFYKMGIHNQKTGFETFNIGYDLPFYVEETVDKDKVLSIKNQQESFIPEQQIGQRKVKLFFNELPQNAGNFGVYNQENLLKNISFNHQRTESDLSIHNAAAYADFKKINHLEAFFSTLQSDRTDNFVWKIFVVLALICLILEIIIQKFIK
ncbi:hypothetical protein B0A58_13730 [Flavobacterium branchiophilum NBRC 15030 = ATCC 35035]|uniref:Putative membrane protein (TIGR02226 family) n=1 Tax=Flavobacterium branchiophilum TaxID=55197 RepID=A0A543G747_9FLAO|nr:BatA and WFA domain-containing protein [Flavobacterium branchiophilum]OXA71541.1 hypothetical protein B0A58_13730 [Flavobacterium branchiophilum NBRC 15030 = ATCC 35035]TQM41907.1 putative membrane protein (TIGR02226 family) [Flavobacterium branchiophilum]GEM55399.1 membrane protein [Flavobacterium branchiophilum NBRC 15030 = ATCC 35035]